jgi:hypothetical protein
LVSVPWTKKKVEERTKTPVEGQIRGTIRGDVT